MLTEKEIERLIWEKLRPKLTDTGLSIVQAFSGGPISEAAAAIAKRLSEGVVYERTNLVAHLNRVAGWDGPGTEIGDGDIVYAIIPGWLGIEGEQYQVTVKIVEGIKDGS